MDSFLRYCDTVCFFISLIMIYNKVFKSYIGFHSMDYFVIYLTNPIIEHLGFEKFLPTNL